jgi:hypothetical protein
MDLGVCEQCYSRPAVHRHHVFIQSKINRKLYGKLIDDSKNIQRLCCECHLNKPVKHFSEKEFCALFGIQTRSKTGAL